ncbi:MAG: hypothetical protein E7290_08525 [Lachnospiraceae bacterium]|nr:hypothetical protein [Lachnospiraceae bacterium]
MEIKRSIDIEDTIRKLLADYYTAYVRPLPDKFKVPSLLIQKVGGTSIRRADQLREVDHFDVSIDARAETEYEADIILRNSIAILEKIASEQNTNILRVVVNTSGSWGQDPVRPDLAMTTARLRVTARTENIII